jgi:hypothetical protein
LQCGGKQLGLHDSRIPSLEVSRDLSERRPACFLCHDDGDAFQQGTITTCRPELVILVQHDHRNSSTKRLINSSQSPARSLYSAATAEPPVKASASPEDEKTVASPPGLVRRSRSARKLSRKR